MNKQKNKQWKLMVCAALVAMLCLGMALPAFAAPPTRVLWREGTELEPAEAGVTKILKMPVGTDIPTISFGFEFEPLWVDLEANAYDGSNMPTIPNATITFDSDDEGDAVSGGAGIKLVIKESGDVLDSITTPWPHAGEYVYRVKEIIPSSGYPVTDAKGFVVAEITHYSIAEYDMHVWVAQDTPTGPLYVHSVWSYIVVKNVPEDGDVDTKVDPTPGGDGEEYFWSQQIFTNTFLKNNGGKDPEDPDQIDDYTVWAIKKKVDGLYADLTKYFEFSVTVRNPATVTTTTDTYIAYILEMDSGNIVAVDIGTDNFKGTIDTDTNGYKYIKFTTGAALTVYLKHGQWLAFIDLPVGSSVAALEMAAFRFMPNYTLKLFEADFTTTNTLDNIAFGFGSGSQGDPIRYLGEAENKADFTNTYKTEPITGILADNLPYIALIAVAALTLAAFVGFAAVKSRRKAKHGA